MHFPYATSDSDKDRTNEEALIIIDGEPFSKECLVEAIRTAFPCTPIIGFSSVEELFHVDRTAIGLVLLRDQSHPVTGCRLTNEIKTILQYCPNAPVVILAMHMSASTASEAIAMGVRGIIPVTTSFKIAIAALQLVLVGGTYYPHFGYSDLQVANNGKGMNELLPEPSEPLVLPPATSRPHLTVVEHAEDDIGTNSTQPNSIFTARELDVLEALQKGWSNKWIAHSLHISENTIKVHIQRIMRKLHATNRTEAVVRHRQLSGLR